MPWLQVRRGLRAGLDRSTRGLRVTSRPSRRLRAPTIYERRSLASKSPITRPTSKIRSNILPRRRRSPNKNLLKLRSTLLLRSRKMNYVPCSRLKHLRMNKAFRKIALFFVLAAPIPASSAVLITEIMYDLEGADQGHEWIELTNTGNAAVDIGSWRLFEQGVNHKLTLAAGAASV